MRIGFWTGGAPSDLQIPLAHPCFGGRKPFLRVTKLFLARVQLRGTGRRLPVRCLDYWVPTAFAGKVPASWLIAAMFAAPAESSASAFCIASWSRAFSWIWSWASCW